MGNSTKLKPYIKINFLFFRYKYIQKELYSIIARLLFKVTGNGFSSHFFSDA